MAKEFLGKGLSFPLRIDADGSFRMSVYEDDIKEALSIVIATAAGERVMRPDFGCGIHEMVFGTMDRTSLARIETDIREAVTKYEPRIEITDLTVTANARSTGKLDIRIEYRVRETNNAFNYVYDFYLHEGNG